MQASPGTTRPPPQRPLALVAMAMVHVFISTLVMVAGMAALVSSLSPDGDDILWPALMMILGAGATLGLSICSLLGGTIASAVLVWMMIVAAVLWLVFMSTVIATPPPLATQGQWSAQLALVTTIILLYLGTFIRAIHKWRRSILNYRRSLGRPLCKQCEYDLTGNISGVCPECGTAIPSSETDEEVSR